MSFWLEDKNGYIGDFASHGGIRDMLDPASPGLAPQQLLDFLDKGRAETSQETKAIADAVKSIKSLVYLSPLFEKATPPVVYTDGVSED